MADADPLLLVVNADDFGLTHGVCAGIVEAVQAGVVTTTSAMVCLPGAAERAGRWAAAIPGRVGIHLQLTDGIPCLPPAEIPSLVGPDGRFPRSASALGAVDPGEVRREWEAQLARLRGAGVNPTHADSHHHAHEHPSVHPVLVRFAADHGLAARALAPRHARLLRAAGVPCADACERRWYGADVTPGRFLALVRDAAARLGAGRALEVMCHPARPDRALASRSRYVEPRAAELRALTSPELRWALREAGIVPATHALLPRPAAHAGRA